MGSFVGSDVLVGSGVFVGPRVGVAVSAGTSVGDIGISVGSTWAASD